MSQCPMIIMIMRQHAECMVFEHVTRTQVPHRAVRHTSDQFSCTRKCAFTSDADTKVASCQTPWTVLCWSCTLGHTQPRLTIGSLQRNSAIIVTWDVRHRGTVLNHVRALRRDRRPTVNGVSTDAFRSGARGGHGSHGLLHMLP